MKKRNKRIIIIIIGILVGLVAGLLVAGTVIRKKIEKELTDTRLGQFRFTCERVSLNIFRESIVLKGVRIRTDERQISPDSLRKDPIQFLDAHINEISASGIRLKALKDKDVLLGFIVLESPDITVVTKNVPKDTIQGGIPVVPPTPRFEQFGIQGVEVRNGIVDWRMITDSDTLKCLVHELNTKLDGLMVDTTALSRQRFLYSDNLSGSIGTLRYTFNNRAYVLALDSIDWNCADNLLNINEVELLPQYSKRDFPRKSSRQSDYMKLETKRIAFSGFDYLAYWNDKQIKADSIHIASGNFISYKDRNASVPRRIKPMMHEVVQDLGVPIDIGKLKVDNFDAAYEELGMYRTTAGRVTFTKIEAIFYGFTNIVKRENQYIELYANAWLMGQGDLSAVVSFPVDPQNEHFEVKAVLTNTQLVSLNPVIKPLANVEIRSGHVSRMDFAMAGNNSSANVNMTLRYEDLKIELLKQQVGGWRERPGLSNLVNWAIIKSDNPDRGGLRTAQTTVQRDPYRSAYNYVWKGVSAAAMQTAETGVAKTLMPK